MPEPSNDSLRVEAGVETGSGAKSEPARMNMKLRGPFRRAQDQLTETLGGFDGPRAELIGLPFGQKQGEEQEEVSELYTTGFKKMSKT
jgi:hypothetical protein